MKTHYHLYMGIDYDKNKSLCGYKVNKITSDTKKVSCKKCINYLKGEKWKVQ